MSDLTAVYRRRLGHVMKWYAPGRFGIFYHFGLFTGGGNATTDERWYRPLAYPTVEAFEQAAPDPVAIARNLAHDAAAAGARYTVLTVWHTCGGLVVLYPTRNPVFFHKTTRDYIGPYLDEARKAGLHPMLYLPCDCHNWDAKGVSPAVPREIGENPDRYADVMCEMVDEIRERYGDKVEGFWLDGAVPGRTKIVPPHIRSLWPDAVIVGNGCPDLPCDDLDYGTSEDPRMGYDPPYDRPSAFRRSLAWDGTPPRMDFNEDIPTSNGWWYHGEEPSPDGLVKDYVDDRFFLLRQMISSLGQRGMWNFNVGIGPKIDGTIQEALRPSLQAIRDFLDWGAEAIYGTKGALGTCMVPGYITYRGGTGYCSITTPFDRPDVFYVLVQEAPTAAVTFFDTRGREPRRISDLRTGATIPFKMWSGPVLEEIDWSDVSAYGVKVLRFEF